jgi:hypothetical protein
MKTPPGPGIHVPTIITHRTDNVAVESKGAGNAPHSSAELDGSSPNNQNEKAFGIAVQALQWAISGRSVESQMATEAALGGGVLTAARRSFQIFCAFDQGHIAVRTLEDLQIRAAAEIRD